MFDELRFNNGTFQVYREEGGDIFLVYGEEYTFDLAKLLDLVEFLTREDLLCGKRGNPSF